MKKQVRNINKIGQRHYRKGTVMARRHDCDSHGWATQRGQELVELARFHKRRGDVSLAGQVVLPMKAAELALEALSAPVAARAAAGKLALLPDLSQREVQILKDVLQPWWDSECDAKNLYFYLAGLGAAGGQGSPAHRRVVHIATLCARTVLPNMRVKDRRESAQLLDILTAWARGEAPEAELRELRDQASTLWSDASVAAAILQKNSGISKEILIFADMAGSAASAVDHAARATDALAPLAHRPPCSPHLVAIVAGHAHAFDPSQGPEWTWARDRRLSELAELIRREVPVCPLGLR